MGVKLYCEKYKDYLLWLIENIKFGVLYNGDGYMFDVYLVYFKIGKFYCVEFIVF